jgi:hypothetical protein
VYLLPAEFAGIKQASLLLTEGVNIYLVMAWPGVFSSLFFENYLLEARRS